MSITDKFSKETHPFSKTGRRIYQCDVCGFEDVWGDGWLWAGSYKELEDDPKSVAIACSEKCKDDGVHAGRFPNFSLIECGEDWKSA